MKNKNFKTLADDTKAVRAFEVVDGHDSCCELLVLSNSYRFQSPLEAQDRFSGKIKGHVYSRISNPTIDSLEGRVSLLESAKHATAFASGMAAIEALITSLAKMGDHIICSGNVFGTTIHLLKEYFEKVGIEISLVSADSYNEWGQHIKKNTKLVIFETPTNPGLKIIDIDAVVKKYKKKGIYIAVDNTLATPIATKPILLGADVVIHSASKYMDGQGRVSGGLVVTSDDRIQQSLKGIVRSKGSCISSFNAWIILKSLETLSLRMAKHSNNALKIAEYMETDPYFKKVIYPGLKSHSQYDLANKQHTNSIHGGIVTFFVDGGFREAWKLMESFRLIILSTNIGDTKTLVTHPYSTTHGRMTKEDKEQYDIAENMLRLSVGIEDYSDLINDIKFAVHQSKS